eukprot:1045370-Pleurochrysis_carterae.AAC.1
MSVMQLLFDTVYVFDGSDDAINGEWPRRAWTRFSNCTSNCPTCPLARSTVSFSPLTAYTKVSEASVTV